MQLIVGYDPQITMENAPVQDSPQQPDPQAPIHEPSETESSHLSPQHSQQQLQEIPSVVVPVPSAQQSSVITNRRHVRTITTAGHITEEEVDNELKPSPGERQIPPPAAEESVHTQEEAVIGKPTSVLLHSPIEQPPLQQQYIEEQPSRYQTPAPNESQYVQSPEQIQERYQTLATDGETTEHYTLVDSQVSYCFISII